MSEEKTITLKKDTLWKVGTFVFAVLFVAALLFGGVINFGGGSGSAVADTGSGSGTGAVDLSPFMQNSQIFPSLGPENADNVVVEFSDFQCPYCAMASGLPAWTAQYQTQYGSLIGTAGKVQEMAANGELRFIYVPMSFLGQESVYAAQAALCANKQDKFWEMHDAIFAASDGPTENDGKYSKDNLKVIAQSIGGLDQSEFANCLDSDETLSLVQTAAAQASTAASGTPTFYVNGQKVSASWSSVQAALQ